MKLLVGLKNPRTGEIKRIKVGFSWTLFLFSSFLGLPLFLRRLYVWGAVFLCLWVINFAAGMLDAATAIAAQAVLFFIFAGLQIWLGVKGNEMTAKAHLENGWTFADPDSEFTKLAKMRWGLFA